jgi:hypothetical protein
MIPRIIASIAFAVVTLTSSLAIAKPLYSSLSEAVSLSSNIVIAKLADEHSSKEETIDIDIQETLKGTIGTGKHTVWFRDKNRHLSSLSNQYVMFLDSKKRWKFVAEPIGRDQLVVNNVLNLRGFYDFNAHIVTPGLITIKQLRKYLSEGSLVYNFSGPVFFPDKATGLWMPGTIKISAMYDAIKKKAAVTGLPQFEVNLLQQPSVGIQEQRDNNFGLTLTYSRNLRRPLILQALVTGLSTDTGNFNAKFIVHSPDVLNQDSFETYLADPRRGNTCYRVKIDAVVRSDERREVFLVFNEKIGCIGELHGWSENPLQIKSVRSNDKYPLTICIGMADGGSLVFAFTPKPASQKDKLPWPFKPVLLYALHRAPWSGILFRKSHDSTEQTGMFAASLDSIYFRELESEPPK